MSDIERFDERISARMHNIDLGTSGEGEFTLVQMKIWEPYGSMFSSTGMGCELNLTAVRELRDYLTDVLEESE